MFSTVVSAPYERSLYTYNTGTIAATGTTPHTPTPVGHICQAISPVV